MLSFFAFSVIIFLIGVIGFSNYDGNWNFIFENMIWFPIEITVTAFVIDRILDMVQSKRDDEKFKRVTRKANELLIGVLKRQIVGIVFNNNVYNPNREEIELYDKIIANPNKYLTDDLFKSAREYNIVGGIKKNYNFIGILMMQCLEMDKHLKEYINRYSIYFNDDIYKQISLVEQTNYYEIGVLNYPNDLGKLADGYNFSGNFDEMKSKLVEFFLEVNRLIELIEE